MSEKLIVSNIIFTNELSLDNLISDYANFIANKLFEENKERGVLYEEEK